MTAKKETPMMRQYREVREGLPPGCLLLFRLGDFYEMFGEDAVRGASVLGITLTKRHDTQMAGIPFHAADNYIQKVLDAGLKVAIVDQTEVPKPGKLVERALTRILTPGTVLEEDQLDPRSGSWLAALNWDKKGLHAAWVDLSAGIFEIASEERPEDLVSCLDALSPTEIVVPAAIFQQDLPEEVEWLLKRSIVTQLDREETESRDPAGELCQTLGVLSLEGFGIDAEHPAVPSAATLIRYSSEMLRRTPGNLNRLSWRRLDETVRVDSATLRNLEIFEVTKGGRSGSLIDCFDQCVTAAGSRLLERWFANPVRDVPELHRRQSLISIFHDRTIQASDLRAALRQTRDLSRILSRLQNRIRNPREIGGIRDTLRQLPEILSGLQILEDEKATDLANRIGEFAELKEILEKTMAEELPGKLNDGGVIRDGYDEVLDRVRSLARNARTWVAEREQEEREKTGIKNLRIKYNGSFGYFIEVTKANVHLVPDEYVRKQTMTNAERYYTEDLKEKEKEILNAEDKAIAREEEIFQGVVDRVLTDADGLRRTAEALAETDLLIAWADLSRMRGYVRPEIDDSLEIDIENGRHPVIEESLRSSPEGIAGADSFVPNSCALSSESHQIAVLTGPNMAGKSTYIRQVALIAFLAHTGCWVPADRCRIGWIDRIFSRVGASDELARGHSTFMVEMNETANILNNSSERSLIILDEIGRGTSTYDGLSIAWAVIENLHGQGPRGPRTLFATHYHELTRLEDSLPRLRNFSVSVKEWNDQIVFMRQVIPGAADRSYGIQVARLAGIPVPVIDRAKEILEALEGGSTATNAPQQSNVPTKKKKPVKESDQLSLF
ncbi:DNA mismatch repair protein MutS [Puniceicoccus vermicola]|uniref:DNA mismatch repair protein MutS n=1 Tax=Puniceicoccus vermicola TaxID=388746 RepID=A0A7X1AV09_9BACT|nr:DNA mismatch repair protein MutS [Puniceicoccus vermicola]MBC2600548.1 DNA mismatch repair protein MutS [Puniceicoccus vermicola]